MHATWLQPCPVALAVDLHMVGVLGCAGTKGWEEGLAGAVSLSDPRPGGLGLGDEVEIGTSWLCEATLTRAFPLPGAKLQD